LLNAAPGLRCVSAYGTAREALEKIPSVRPDVVLVDLNLAGTDGINCVARLKAQLAGLHVLVLSMYQQTDLIFQALRAGASGHLLKNRPGTELIQAIEHVHAGAAPMSTSIARKVLAHFQKRHGRHRSAEMLTLRERT